MPPATRRELRRVRAHLRLAEVAARGADDSHLDPLKRLVRALLLDELAAYRARGRFPRNKVVHGLQPVFVDDAGTRCAVAHLLDASGASALVADIASRRNLAYVDELADEPALAAWLDAAGLTLAEAAAIQPGYTYVPSSCVCGTEVSGARPPYGTPATAVLDIQVLESNSAETYGPVPGVVVAIDGTTSEYTMGQTLRVLASGELVTQGSIVLAPVGGPTHGYQFNIPDAGHGPPPMDAGPDAAPTPPVDAGGPLLGGYLLRGGSILCQGAIGPLTRAQFIDAVKAPMCTSALAAIDPRWTRTRSEWLDPGGSCAVPVGSVGTSGTLSLLLALLATRRRRLQTAATVRRLRPTRDG